MHEMDRATPPAEALAALTELSYELMDAHEETVRLTAQMDLEDPWAGHLRYLRDLQRAGRELLARMHAAEGPA